MSGEKACPLHLTVTRGWAPLRPRGHLLPQPLPVFPGTTFQIDSLQSIPGGQGQRLVEQDVRPNMR